MTTKALAVYFKRGSVVRVVQCRAQGILRNQVGTVRESTRSLVKPFPRVYFVRFDGPGISAWLAEDQLEVEVQG